MKLVELSVKKIRNPSVFQPRETFAKEELEELAESIKENGLLNPIHVKQNGEDTYQIMTGERRWRAAQMAGMEKIYAFVKDVTQEEQRIESLIENVHRKDLNMIEKGRGMMEIFKINDIDMKLNEIKSAMADIEMHQIRGDTIKASSQKIHEICSKLNIKPRTIRYWIEAISADEEVIEDHLKTPEDKRIPDSTIARVATIKDKELQKKTYTKIKSQELGQKKASEFVSKIKKLPDIKQEIALTTDIPIEVISEEPEDDLELTKKELEKKYREKIAQKLLSIDSKQTILAKPKHIDDIPNSQLYYERSLWNIQKFLQQIDIFTLGTDDKKLEQLIDLLEQIKSNKQNKQVILIDTRDTPYSQFKPEFNKSNIEKELKQNETKYEHIRELGVPKDLREQLFSGEMSEDDLWNHYEKDILTNELKTRILRIIDANKTPVFLCTEISPIRCHRHIISNWLEKEKNLISWDL